MISNCIVLCTSLSSYNSLQIKRRGEDGNKVITIRIRVDILDALDKIAAETNRSRNELINIILRYGVQNMELE
ncbi:ribbon-helix-helix protein, CopG family [Flintibacter muris]|uniref:ribbon-helix-helix protein, CopG family n=1 Tax=Flintibacter muris TaxID=2941327 RepID=UPI00203DF1B5|nr:ribbon-helix-helix protein, CopG family [Flintibacter muris]